MSKQTAKNLKAVNRSLPKAPDPAPQTASTALAPLGKDDMVIQTDMRHLPDYIKQGDQRGTEMLGVADIIIPRLEVVQSTSPAVTIGDAGFIKGAAAGMLNNSVTRKLYGDKAVVIGVHYAIQWLVWKDRKAGGGFFGAFPSQDEADARAEKEGGEAQKIEVLDTPTHLCLLLDPESGVEEIMMSMPRTKAKVSRQWNTMVKLAGGPRFGRAYTIGTALQKNKAGEQFFNFTVTPLGFVPKRLFDRAEKLYQQISAGERKMAMDVTGFEREDVAAEGHGTSKM